MMEQNRSFATSDSDIVQWFANRSSAWYGWAKDTAPGNKQQCFNRPEEEIQELMAQLKTFMVLAADGKTPAELDREKKLPYILLHGMLANFICAEIFANPFSILDSVPGLSASSNTGSAFKESKDVDRKAKQAAQSDLAVTSKVVDSLYGYLVDCESASWIISMNNSKTPIFWRLG
ncbi:hypothetical protein M406DRAFT_320240 [Cryphonectria parasitica EP155]|uniref:Uncharacterized protein n=1 Tax=Cryphonectria parasitica (strain ATCC 38755 / EP155) TaxID=660469 RepID=A0A9P5CT12_CRYP1|nr:uncharacterized protein M406DRAFT_320240 [Cryphonectria parasitica EP155]KAF3770179.1 hypothetical protein M406DRAFT_320240 [Cryphonectria parasitica EP155]